MIMKKLLFTLMLLLMTMVAFAEKVEVNGLYYELINKTLTAEVVKSDGDSYSGNIVIPESIEYGGSTYNVTSLGGESFKDCNSLLSVTIPNSITIIKYDAFCNCNNLTTVIFSSNLEIIEGGVFSGCNALSAITLPNSLKKIGNNAFRFCSSLASIEIPDGVTSIGNRAFQGCNGLTTISVGSGVEVIEGEAFQGCLSLASVHIKNLSAWCNIDFSQTGYVGWQETATNPLYNAHHLFLNGEEILDLVIPDDVKSLNGNFDGCTGLKSVQFQGKVVVGDNSFRNCTGLEKVSAPNLNTWLSMDFALYDANPLIYAHHLYLNNEEIKELYISDNITSIGNNIFRGFNSLIKISMPNTVTSIGELAFCDCSSLKVIIIPGSVEKISARAFMGCHEIEDVYCFAEKIPSTGEQVFRDALTEYATLHVPEKSINDYTAISPWSEFGKIVALVDEDPQPTGILFITNYESKRNMWYDLNGHKLDAEPSAKGIYINNGKKVVK